LDDERLLNREGWQRGGGKYVGRARRFQYVRYINPETGDMLPLGQETEDTPHWSDLYDGSEGLAFYGHVPQMSGQPRVSKHAIGLDTAVVAGRNLTAAVLTYREGGVYGSLSYKSVGATPETYDHYVKHKAAREARLKKESESNDDV
jgi:hypothetical protein